MRLREVLENSTHDYTGDGHFRVCARFCGAYFIIVRTGLREDRIEPGCRVPSDVDVFGECPKAGRLKVETAKETFRADQDQNANRLWLAMNDSRLAVSTERPNGEAFNYYATPETAIDIIEWLARQLKAEIRWLPKGGRPDPVVKTSSSCCQSTMLPVDSESRPAWRMWQCSRCGRRIPEPLPFATGSAAMRDIDLGCATGVSSAGLASPSALEIRPRERGMYTPERCEGCGYYQVRLKAEYGGTEPITCNQCGKVGPTPAKVGQGYPGEMNWSGSITVPVEVLVALRAVAYGPTSGLDKRCAFCHAFPPEHVRYSQAGSPHDCPVIAARQILMDRGEKWSLEGRT